MISGLISSVFLIKSSDPKISGFGTGFAIYRDEETAYIVTCAHVIHAVGGPEKVTVNGLLAQVVALGSKDGIEGIDLAVLSLRGLPNDFPLLQLSTSAQKGKEFAAPGFRSYSQQGQTERKTGIEFRALYGHIGEPTAVGLPQTELIPMWDLKITGDFMLEHGYSGSPVVDTISNVVVGVVISLRDGGKKGSAISLETLAKVWPEIPPSVFRPEPVLRATDGNVIYYSISTLVSPLPTFDPQWLKELDASGGAIPLDSHFYVERQDDAKAKDQILRSGVTIRIKGSRQMGKTSLLARLIQHAIDHKYPFVYIDFQALDGHHLESLDTFLYYLADCIATDRQTNQGPDYYWRMNSGGSKDKLTTFLSHEVLEHLTCPFIIFLDEVDLLFGCGGWRKDFFSLIRVWHNKRAMPQFQVWRKLNIVLTYSTEAAFFIADLNQSPFNVGTDFPLGNFDRAEVELLNYKHGNPVKTTQEMDSIMRLLNGHPFLVRKALYVLAIQQLTVEALLGCACDEDGPFSDHLRSYLLQFDTNQEQRTAMKSVIETHVCPTDRLFYQLRSAGLVVGAIRTNVQSRCDLYRQYFQKHL